MRVAIMRPPDRLIESARLARQLGMEPVCGSPLIPVLKDTPAFDLFLNRLFKGEVKTLIFTSATGVESTLQLAEKRNLKEGFLERLRELDIIAIGHQTGVSLGKYRINSHLPSSFTSDGIVELIARRSPAGEIYVLRSDSGSGTLERGIRALGFEFHEVIVYSLVKELKGLDPIIESTLKHEIDAFAFTSSLTALTFLEALVAGGRDPSEIMSGTVIGAIGPPTRFTLESWGLTVDVVPHRATFHDLLISVRDTYLKKQCADQDDVDS